MVTLPQLTQIKELAHEILINPMGDLLWEANLTKKHIDVLFPMQYFWMDVLKAWSELAVEEPVGKGEILQQLIWYNSNILIGKKMVFFSKWSKKRY